MNLKRTLKDFARHPVTLGSAVVAAVNGFVPLPFVYVLVGVGWSNLGTLASVSMMGGFQIAPNLGGVPGEVTEAMQVTAILLGVLWGWKRLSGVWRDAEAEFD